jgi:hypothetical protein
MRLIIAFRLEFAADGSLSQAPLGYTVRDTAAGGVTAEELDELKARILSKAQSNNPLVERIEVSSSGVPRVMPEHGMTLRLVDTAPPASIAIAEASLVGLGFSITAASQAVKQHGPRRTESVSQWIRRKMSKEAVRDPVALITTCLRANKSP